jgi:hypothetical protein
MKDIKCEKCGQPLKLLHWNSQKDILICTNDKCPAYRNPVPYTEVEINWLNNVTRKSHKKPEKVLALAAPEI